MSLVANPEMLKTIKKLGLRLLDGPSANEITLADNRMIYRYQHYNDVIYATLRLKSPTTNNTKRDLSA